MPATRWGLGRTGAHHLHLGHTFQMKKKKNIFRLKCSEREKKRGRGIASIPENAGVFARSTRFQPVLALTGTKYKEAVWLVDLAA